MVRERRKSIGPAASSATLSAMEKGNGDISGRRALNATAYRIFRLLQWLIEGPVSVEVLNRRFQDDPLINKQLSTDSVWLYINTLKALGCRIRRPSPKNNFQYELLHHPFGVILSEAQMEMLTAVKILAQDLFSHQEMLLLDQFMKKLIRYSACSDTEEAAEKLFARSRSCDYESHRQCITLIETGIQDGALLRIQYDSPLNGPESFYFLPELVFYEQGLVYVRGDRHEAVGPSSLRMDRIIDAREVEEECIRADLLKRRQQLQPAIIRLYTEQADRFQSFELKAHQGIYEEQVVWVADAVLPYHEVRFLMRDAFYLKQKLLSCGAPFQVIEPVTLRQDMEATLRGMLDLYRLETS